MQALKIIIAILLSPIGILYWCVTSIRNWMYDLGVFKSTEFDVPIISVGNLAVGGSGKTPMVEYIIRHLQNEYTIAVLSRGYGRKTKGFLWVNVADSPNECGDEPLQIKTKFDSILVAVCEKRVDGVVQILKEHPEVNLILLDDAFQHRAIKPSTQLLLSTYNKPFFKDWILPAGRLRERRNGANRADAIIFTKCPTNYDNLHWEDKTVFFSKIVYQNPKVQGPVYGFGGLADDTLFKNHLAKTYLLQGFKSFGDHHNFTQEDLDELIKKAKRAKLVCTEKDWTKIKYLNGVESVNYVSITNTIDGQLDFIGWLKTKIAVI